MSGKDARLILTAAERARQALELRKAGATYEQIAERLGYRAACGAYQAVRRTLMRTLREPADEVRKLEEERLDALLLACWPRAAQGDGRAIDRVLRIMERRAKLLGLDAAEKLAVDVGQVLASYLARTQGDNDDNSDPELSSSDGA